MELVSVNVGRPREVEWRGELVRTAIFKEPAAGPVAVARLGVAGDEQADPSVHGGVDKAVYAYPAEHYAYWQRELGLDTLPWGAFGENLTTRGLSEGEIRSGDRLRVGSAELVVTQPRTPCYKLGLRFARPDMVRRFLAARRPGFYLSVLTPGEIGAGDRIEVLAAEEPGASVAQLFEGRAARPV